jgi:hypothetical protein
MPSKKFMRGKVLILSDTLLLIGSFERIKPVQDKNIDNRYVDQNNTLEIDWLKVEQTIVYKAPKELVMTLPRLIRHGKLQDPW